MFEARCQCGCGLLAPISKYTVRAEGRIKGQPLRYIRGHNSGGNLRYRLLSQLTFDQSSGCLLWSGTVLSTGYGQIMVNGRKLHVHRVMWEMFEGPIPEGLVLDHVKDRGCVNQHCASIAHLEPVTVRENTLRGTAPSALNAVKSHCQKGHPFDAENTYMNPSNGQRVCRICKRDWNRQRPRRKAAA